MLPGIVAPPAPGTARCSCAASARPPRWCSAPRRPRPSWSATPRATPTRVWPTGEEGSAMPTMLLQRCVAYAYTVPPAFGASQTAPGLVVAPCSGQFWIGLLTTAVGRKGGLFRASSWLAFGVMVLPSVCFQNGTSATLRGFQFEQRRWGLAGIRGDGRNVGNIGVLFNKNV